MMDALRGAGASLVASAVLEGGPAQRQATPTRRPPAAWPRRSRRPAARRRCEAAAALGALAAEWETSPATLAIAFALEHPLLASALVGATSPAQLDETLAAVALHAKLSAADRARLRAVNGERG